MQKICALILLSAIASNYEALPQTKWSRPTRHSQGQLIRERRQFPFGEWIPLSQPCPTCRPFADPLDAGLRTDSIGLTPPRPPAVTRQIHGEGNFFAQDESSILSVPPPPPSAIPRHPISSSNGNFQFSNFGQQFNSPLTIPTQKVFPQTQQIQFLPQTFLSNQPLLIKGNQQILSNLNAQNNLFGQDQNQQQINNGKVANFNSEFKAQKLPENVVLEQNKKPVVPKQVFSNKPQPFTHSQQNQQHQLQTFIQQQSFNGQQQHPVNLKNSILTPPPAPNNISQDIVIPGLDKEEIQLLYVPVETLRQKGTAQEQLLTQQPQNIQLYNRVNGVQRPVNNNRPTEQTLVTSGRGHFVTQKGNSHGQTENSLKVTSTQPFSTSVTPSTLLLQHLPFQQTPQPFVSATPATPTIQPFVTPASVFPKFSPFTPETTLSHLSTVPSTIQFSQSDVEFGTTPKTLSSQEAYKEEIASGKPQFSGLKNTGFNQERPLQQHLQQSFVNQQQAVTQKPQLNTVFRQEQPKELLSQNQFPHQINQQQIALQKQQEHQRFLQQQQQKEMEEQRFLEQQRQQKELEEQRLLQEQQRQKELEQQRFLQKQKELEEQRLLHQRRQKELEQQRFLQKQKELEEQKLLQQRQKELEEQRFLQEQRQKELEEQRLLQLQRQIELEEKRRLQLKQKEEEEQRILRFQKQQKELESQRLLQQQQEEQQRLLQQQKLQKQKQENLKKQQQFQLLQQQQQQKQNLPQQVLHQVNRHVLPANDKLNFIPQLEKESEPEDQQLVPHQPPLSVFFKGFNGVEARITDVLRELRSSNTITVLDQYFEKMPKVFVGPAGLTPPLGYGKFELPYLSNLESNRIERRIDKLPFFVAPLNFVPPPGYAKIPFPAPHVGSVVVSSESNPAMTLKSAEKTSIHEEGSFPVVGPELPGLINNLDTKTTTIKPSTYVSTPSLPQTTAQLRNRRPNSSLYKSQNRKPITRTRPTTTSKPEVTQPIQKTENSEDGIRKPFNRFLNRRRQQTKIPTESLLKDQQDGKSLENRHYSVEVYHQEKNQFPKSQQKKDEIQEKQNDKDEYDKQFEQHTTSIDRITPSGHGVFEVHPTPDFSRSSQTEAFELEDRRPEAPDFADVNLQGFEDGPLPTGSAKTITQELYHPNGVNQAQGDVSSKAMPKPVSTQGSVNYQSGIYEDRSGTTFSGISDASPTVGLVNYKGTFLEEQTNAETTPIVEYEKQDDSSERHYTTETPRTKAPFTPGPSTTSEEQSTKRFLDSNEQYTAAFAEISKPHLIPGFVDSSARQQSKFSEAYPTAEISTDLQAPFSQKHSQEFHVSGEVKPTQNSAELFNHKFAPTASSNEQYLSEFEGIEKDQQSPQISTSQISPTAPGAIDGQYTTGFAVNPQSQNSAEVQKNAQEERINRFISLHSTQNTASPLGSAQQYFPSSTEFPFPSEFGIDTIRNNESLTIIDKNQVQISSTPETSTKVTVNPSIQTYSSESGSVSSVQIKDQTLTSEDHSQDTADNLPNTHGLKLSNPSIVRVRTRVRGKSRGQVNFAASQSTTPVPFTRSGVENVEQEYTTKTNHFRDYHPVKTSKFNQFRGVKKPVRTTTENPTESEQKANVYTIRPQRRPLNPSTVSTKRIRRPTTPLPFAETETEAFGISTVGSYSQSEHSDISPSGVSNDVYYEQSSLSPVKHKLRKHFDSAEHKSDFIPSYVSSYQPQVPTYSSFAQEYSQEPYGEKNLSQTPAPVESLESSEKYPEWNPSESGFDVSGIVLTTTSTPGHEDQLELEELKKSLDSKKAFDPDSEKKTGRRRVRVRVHKRPHENFETAESQNLRTVANVLVPPTTTYKPNDESSFHQLAKNADFSFGGQKLFGLRSREYFRKRLNLTASERDPQTVNRDQPIAEKIQEVGETTERLKSGFVRKVEKSQKNDNETTSTQSNESSEGNNFGRPKFRGFVRKIVKHGKANKEADSESNKVPENEESEGKYESAEFHPRQPFKVNQGSSNYTGKFSGTRHKTFVRYVKKNKIRQHETESHLEPNIHQPEKEEQGFNQTTESHTSIPELQKEIKMELPTAEVQAANVEETSETHLPVTHTSKELENLESQQSETTEEPKFKKTQQPLVPTTQAAVEFDENHESSSQTFQESVSDILQPVTPLTQQTGLYLTSKPKFYQTLRPLFQRTTQTGFQKIKESDSHSSTIEHSIQESLEKRPGFTRLKYGKTTVFGTTNTEKSEEIKKPSDLQLKNKNLHTLEVRKYLRTKSREGAFSQFSKNKYLTSEKTETTVTIRPQEKEFATERIVGTSSNESKTTQVFESQTDSTEVEDESTENYDESEQYFSTTETVMQESKSSEEDVTSSGNTETTTENEILTSVFQESSSEELEKITEPKLVVQTTEKVEVQQTEYQPDIYRFSKNSFSFDEAEKFTGTKNRAHVRNITSDIIENTASFSAPGVEKRPDIRVVTHRADEHFSAVTEPRSDVTHKEKTEVATTELNSFETTTDYPETTDIETTASTEAITKAKVAKILKTSTTTKISHETEICYRGKCIRTKSENPDEDLKLLVDSASTMKIEKTKT